MEREWTKRFSGPELAEVWGCRLWLSSGGYIDLEACEIPDQKSWLALGSLFTSDQHLKDTYMHTAQDRHEAIDLATTWSKTLEMRYHVEIAEIDDARAETPSG